MLADEALGVEQGVGVAGLLEFKGIVHEAPQGGGDPAVELVHGGEAADIGEIVAAPEDLLHVGAGADTGAGQHDGQLDHPVAHGLGVAAAGGIGLGEDVVQQLAGALAVLLLDEQAQLALLVQGGAGGGLPLLFRERGLGRAIALADDALAEEAQQAAQGVGPLVAPLGDGIDADGAGQLGHLLLGLLTVVGEEGAGGDAAFQLAGV